MLTLASWYQREHWRGRPMRISRFAGRGLTKAQYNWGEVPCLVPDWELVKAHRSRQISRERFSSEYMRGLEERWEEVSAWLSSLKPEEDLTLLCHEREGEFCHRRLVSEVVRGHCLDIPIELH